MESPASPTRSRSVPATGARLLFLVGLLLVVIAAYLFLAPLERETDGRAFGCGSAANPPSETLGKGVCGSINQQRAMQAGAFAIGGLVVAFGGILVFGFGAKTDTRQADEERPAASGVERDAS